MTANEDAVVFQALLATAATAADDGDWNQAARGWVAAGSMAMSISARDTAASLFASGAEAFRRDDRPKDALSAFQLALGAGLDEPQARVGLSAVLASMGRMEGALSHARAVSPHDLGLDAEAGILLARGTRSELHECWRQLSSPLSRAFRRAQWLRMGAELDGARRVLLKLEQSLIDQPAGRGGVRLELAELDALQGKWRAAVQTYRAAAEDHERAGRMALVWATTASHARCLLSAGMDFIGRDLAFGVQWAEERQLRVLRLDLQLVLGWQRGDARLLKTVGEEASTLGLFRRTGRAELVRAQLLGGPDRWMCLQEAAHLLEEDRPLWIRARVAYAEALWEMSPEAGTRLATELVREVERAGMEPEGERLAALEG